MDDIKLFAKNEKDQETLIQTIRIYNQDIGMEFGIEKSAILIMKSGKREITERVEVANQERIRMLEEKKNNKYLEMLAVNIIKQAETKEKIRKEYLRWMWKH